MALMMSNRAATALPCSVAADGSRSTRMRALMATAPRADGCVREAQLGREGWARNTWGPSRSA